MFPSFCAGRLWLYIKTYLYIICITVAVICVKIIRITFFCNIFGHAIFTSSFVLLRRDSAISSAGAFVEKGICDFFCR